MTESDNYDILEKIGHGSFGVIRKVRRKTDGFVMCRKEISYLRMSQKEREQLHAEFQILSHLRHPNIVAYYHREHLKQSQDLHLYMEYCGNGDLGRVIKDLAHKGVHAQESFVWSIFSQLVSALYRCHYGVDPPEVGGNVLGLHQGQLAHKPPAGAVTILHRDLKPENVFLGEDNSVKLGDFGLSKMIKSHDFASTYVGTPFYMSPEICAAEKYTLKSDIWSLGCIIYELCAREPPFNAKTHCQLVQKIKDGKVAMLPAIYSPELNQVIRDCLRVNPDTRPDTASLINLPIVRLMRKEKEVVDLNRLLRNREDALARREKDLAEKVATLDSSRAIMRQELDSSLRREWEVKARLEIDRLVQAELEALKSQFEAEVQARVGKQLAAHQRALTQQQQQLLQQQQQQQQQQNQHQQLLQHHKHHQSRHSSRSSADFNSSKSSSCRTTTSSADDFALATDATEITVDSPAPGPPSAPIITTTAAPPATTSMAAATAMLASKRSSTVLAVRTPHHRAQTMFVGNVGTPMDIEMVSPSPIAIQSLSLSPRHTAATKPPGSSGNIFADATAMRRHQNGSSSSNADDQAWRGREAESDEDDLMPSPSVTRNLRSVKNPFTSRSKPVLQSNKSAPLRKLRAVLSSAASTKSAAAAVANPDFSPTTSTSLPQSRSGGSRNTSPDKPDRRLSKIPSVASLHNITIPHGEALASNPNLAVTTSVPRRGSMDRKHSTADLGPAISVPLSVVAPPSSGWTSKVVTGGGGKVNIRGRTLIELQKARAGGRPMSAVIPGPSPSALLAPGGSSSASSADNSPSPPKRIANANGRSAGVDHGHVSRVSGGGGAYDVNAPVWDPETDDMPSPFLKARQVHII